MSREATLLVELFTEELPPKALKELSEAFGAALRSELQGKRFLSERSALSVFATPRRLAARISGVRESSPETEREIPGPSAKAAPAAIKGFAKKAGVALEALEKRETSKGEVFVARVTAKGVPLAEGLQSALAEALEKLPIPKMMSYQLADGQTTVRFVRPAHGLVALHGDRVVAVSVLGLAAGRITHGHRFQGVKDISVASADAYEEALAAHGKVIASFEDRRAEINRQLRAKAAELGASLSPEEGLAPLLDEVTALVEYPSVYAGEFEREFLSVPQECLILTMRQHQRYFPLFAASGKLTHRFLIVSNMRLAEARNIVEGNERVVRPRLADARFFFDTDKKTRLEARVPQLASIVFHNKLGTQLERVERLQLLAGHIARAIGADPLLAERAAWLSKADLQTAMVGEFPELQGIMGRYYAALDGENPVVADAIGEHYRPRFAGDELPSGETAIVLALADKLDTLIGIWGIGTQPTGEKDPFGLRRAAIGVLRILSERGAAMTLDLGELLGAAFEGFPKGKLGGDSIGEVHGFMLDQMRALLRDRGFDANEIEAVLVEKPTRIARVLPRIEAVRVFRNLPEAQSLAAANKRIQNILRQSGTADSITPTLLAQDEEKRLHATMLGLAPRVEQHLDKQDYAAALKDLAGIRGEVDAFFDKVLVNTEDEFVRRNRLALLTRLATLMNRVADISKLAA